MNLIKGRLQKLWLSNNFSVKFTRSRVPAASLDQSRYASNATAFDVTQKGDIILMTAVVPEDSYRESVVPAFDSELKDIKVTWISVATRND